MLICHHWYHFQTNYLTNAIYEQDILLIYYKYYPKSDAAYNVGCTNISYVPSPLLNNSNENDMILAHNKIYKEVNFELYINNISFIKSELNSYINTLINTRTILEKKSK